MSGLTGKKSSTLKKEQVKESKLLSTGVKSIKFWHEAQADGETAISFGSLSMPADIAAQGLSNPTSTEILAANLALFHTNVEVHSSLNQKLMEGLTYVVKNNEIKFVNGYTATEGEVFAVVYKNDVITGTNVVDARPLTATGVLTAGDTDFNVGEAFKTNAYPSHQIGEVIVFVDGEIQFRNTANATAGAGQDGNYQEVHSANGYGTIIRFNEDFASDKNIVVMSRNLIAERPDISMMQLIEKLGGQLDAVIEYTAALAGVDESEFYVMPNQIDLKAFGDQVIANKQKIANLEKILDLEIYIKPDEVVAYDGFLGVSGTFVRLKTQVQSTASTIISVDNSSYTKITALENCIITASAGGERPAGGHNSQVRVYDSEDNVLITSRDGQASANNNANASLSFVLNAGDYVVFDNGGDTYSDAFTCSFTVRATSLVKTKISDLI